MDLFKIVPDNFFSLLNCPNKDIYAGCILEAFKTYEEGSILGIDKKIVFEAIVDYLTKHDFMPEELEEDEDSNDELEEDLYEVDMPEVTKEVTPRQKASFVLRKMEECGWISIDVTNDYQEVLNFYDYAINMCEAMLNMEPDYYDFDAAEGARGVEYRGYIYTIYSLLTSNVSMEYSVLMEQVYRNTKMFIRELRKLDSKLKIYIRSIMDHTEIKELMDQLMEYKLELVDRSYFRLKTSDNVSKYRLEIVNKLESFLADNKIMNSIAAMYRSRYADEYDCYNRACRTVTEVIDVFNQLDEMILDLDAKNKQYINTTIGRIEFLLADDDNITGQINTILKYIATMNKQGRTDKAVNFVSPIFRLNSVKNMQGEQSLYSPRGRYQKAEAQRLLEENIDITDMAFDFFKDIDTEYTEDKVLAFLDANLVDGSLKASQIIHNQTIEEILMVVYVLVYANNNEEHPYVVTRLDSIAKFERFKFRDFLITKEEA